MKIAIEVLQDNRLIGSHVFQRGDVVELDERVAKEYVKRGHAVISAKPPIPIPVSGPRHLKIREREAEQSAANPAPAAGERSVSKGRPSRSGPDRIRCGKS
jgi:hypothetical protein